MVDNLVNQGIDSSVYYQYQDEIISVVIVLESIFIKLIFQGVRGIKSKKWAFWFKCYIKIMYQKFSGMNLLFMIKYFWYFYPDGSNLIGKVIITLRPTVWLMRTYASNINLEYNS